ncbi:MAG TPA: transglycosylase family protein [Solirubrobacterales bacterium]|nr:transglycosylase family protein [Solirubrobacterales bacterium]
MVNRRHAIAAACAAFLAFALVPAGAGFALAPSAPTAGTTETGLPMIERPSQRFERSLTAHLGRVAERRERREARRERREERRERRQARRQERLAAAPPATPVQVPGEAAPGGALEAIAACESGGDPGAVNPAGYYGKYQFDLSTWQSVGGSGNPAAASEAEQDYRAGLLYSRAGASPWPVCGS